MGQMETDLRLMISASDLPGGCSTVLSGRDSLGPPTVSTVLALVHVTGWAVQLGSRAQRLATVHGGWATRGAAGRECVAVVTVRGTCVEEL